MATAADTIGTFGTSGDWGAAANWSGVEPVANEVALLQNIPATRTINAGLTGNPASGALTELRVARSCLAKIGTGAGSPLELQSGVLHYEGGGEEAFFKGDYTDVNAMGLALGANALVLNSNATQITNTRAFSGHNTLSGSGTFTNLFVLGQLLRRAGAVVVIEAGAALTNATINGGRTVNNMTGTATLVIVKSGTYFQEAGTHTRVILLGGTYVFNDGTIITLDALGGFFDATRSADDRAITTMNSYPGATLNLGGTSAVDITNDNRYGANIIEGPVLS